ncbi:AAA family ATPase [Halomonas cerina]|uniref:Vesicle-fusing ATPase n=1 Tax=Halomonas cerina TaxID=447424 RepID=A0A839VGX8_9GAMM|nr:ATP-binding protein [Halomonas cerina]MBB3191874.1 vesicle-fusing ATPase [Halomonas cerina]
MSATADPLHPAARITPELQPADPLLAHWLGQASLRLRREICWCWFQRSGREETGSGTLPPVTDPAAEGLDLVRYDGQKRVFFQQDATARYLTDCLDNDEPDPAGAPRGGFTELVRGLALPEADRFVLALAMLGRLDAAVGPVISACMNDLSRPWPTLALAQRLWEEPLAVTAVADPMHPLRRHGVLRLAGDDLSDWQCPLRVHATVAGVLSGESEGLPAGLVPVPAGGFAELDTDTTLLADRLAAQPPGGLQVIPLIGPRDSDFDRAAANVSAQLDAPLATFAETAMPAGESVFAAATVCWLLGHDLLLPEGWEQRFDSQTVNGLMALPLRCYAPSEDRKPLANIPSGHLLPALTLATPGYEQRRGLLLDGLGDRAAALGEAVDECARRFRLAPKAFRRAIRGLAYRRELDGNVLAEACRQEAVLFLGELAQPVTPRFAEEELVLPDAQWEQYREIIAAMRALTAVHYQWGAAQAWNDAGLSVMFAGPPGTGKTMAAEALARALDLPMFRVDLSQIVNKYVGETEKNLKRVFDAAESSDCLMFFDECDALFGKRTDVRDAHDRFANIEISYLLERMERFKGLAVLATNRRRDLDEAFMRRLRYIVEFPMPGEAERERIWRQSFPPRVDTSGLDFRYLARQFPFAGGHIRSVTLNASLQAAARHGASARRVELPEVLVAVKRELEKLGRAAGTEQFGRYRELLEQEVA